MQPVEYEVEQKFPVADLEAIRAGLAALGAKVSAPREEVDLYFAHPAQDFAATDEALRLRQKGGSGFITYKGPKIDAATKTRREIELPLGEGPDATAAWRGLLEALGFAPSPRCASCAARRLSPGKAGPSRCRSTRLRAWGRSSNWN